MRGVVTGPVAGETERAQGTEQLGMQAHQVLDAREKQPGEVHREQLRPRRAPLGVTELGPEIRTGAADDRATLGAHAAATPSAASIRASRRSSEAIGASAGRGFTGPCEAPLFCV